MKLSVIGTGSVGSSLAQRVIDGNLVDELVLVDKIKGLAKGYSLDLEHSTPLCESNIDVRGSKSYEDISNSDLIVITAGAGRKEGMDRSDLLKQNGKIIKSISSKINEFSPNSIVVVVTNPLDLMVYKTYKTMDVKRNKVMGMAGSLDSARFKYLLAKETGFSPKDIQTLVIGPHSNKMIPLKKRTYIRGIPIQEFLSKGRINELVNATKKAGERVVNYLGDGSAKYAPSSALLEIIKSIKFNENRLIPVSFYLNGEYDIKDVCLGVPAIIGSNGVKEVIELDLADEEMEQMKEAEKEVKDQIENLKDI
ncbi:MAG: Malate/lactate dehydrogenase Mdh [Candidatus Methanohalarchaeum thermophilum]|uniref:Malate dehydrogenase n=1 Tax=Methanohalarchaeum thermophilum TaxID=1903181 RepID=A0A1Q6DXC8_METT1|nr:MAG: Malate/lactate dehydrogenase Mdh [Candidatus Methanohalarchaeum thermophilum]